MAVGDVAFSGAFTTANLGAGGTAEIFIEAQLGAVVNSGALIFVVPEVNTSQFWIGVRKGHTG